MSRRPATINEPFASLPLSLLQSPAFCALSWDARRVLDRLMIEHLRHGGHRHDRLVCTYSDFAASGIRQRSIASAIRDCVELGMLVVTKQGTPSISTRRQPSEYRLTFLGGRAKGGYVPPTDEWRQVESEDEARARLARAAGMKSAQHVRRAAAAKLRHGNGSGERDAA